MVIHVVRPGDSLYSIAREYGVPLSQLLNDNQLPDPSRLVVGQTIVVRFPQQVHTVQAGQTLSSIALMYGLTVRQLQRNNPVLGGGVAIYPGQTLVISYKQEIEGTLSVNGYAYPFIDRALLRATLPYLTFMTPFTYGITENGGLVDLDDAELIAMAKEGGVAPLMHLSTLTEEGGFSNELASLVLNNADIQKKLIDNIVTTIQVKGYRGLDVDFEFVFARDAGAYAAFIRNLTRTLNPLGLPVIVALAPKTSSTQRGLLYEGHDYVALGAAANEVLLMTYEWGYTYGPPMAVAPLPNVRAVVEYALTQIPAEKMWLGVPNYGYDWPLPFVQGETKATSISNRYAVQLALRYNAEILYDENAQSPWFRYRDESGMEHEVWFEDARSIRAKLALIPEYGLRGAGYWNLMRPFPQNWQVLASLYNIRDAQ
ncbi:MAG: LysM peptidoglycan-binding domain-containing protein [Oscillospiraceae bacterium]